MCIRDRVIVGSVGYGDDKKLTVIGDVVNIASRIESTNKDAGTRLLISENAFSQVKDSLEIDNYLRLKLRGSSNLITLYEVSNLKKDVLKDYRDADHKIINGNKKDIPINLPKNLCAHSHQNIILNSLRVIE